MKSAKLAGLFALAQLASFALPSWAATPCHIYSGYGIFFPLVFWLPELSPFIFCVPLGVLLSLGAFISRPKEFSPVIRNWDAFHCLVSTVGLACLAWLAFGEHWFASLSGSRVSFLLGLPIFVGSFLHLLGPHWSSLKKTARGLPGRSIFLVGLLLGLLLAAVVYAERSRSFQNYGFRCPSLRRNHFGLVVPVIWEPDRGVPFTLQSDAELRAFCSRMQQQFLDANMTAREANRFFSLLKASRMTNLQYSNCNLQDVFMRQRPLQWKKEIMIKRLTEERYQAFFYGAWDVGVDYWFVEVKVERGTIDQATIIEHWGEYANLDWFLR